jgi:hypothetical protein
MAQKLEELKADKNQTEIMAQKQSGRFKANAERLIGDFKQEIINLEHVLVSSKDIFPRMHAEFETECKKKIERLANAVIDPSTWESLPPLDVVPQANAQPLPEPLAPPSDLKSEKGVAEP